MSSPSQLSLLGQRRFGPFFVTQLSGAFNDSLFKQLLILLVTYQTTRYSTLSPGLLVNMAAGLFILPFLLFSALGGQLADRYDKATLIRAIKIFEVGIVAVASIGFYFNSLVVLMSALFMMGCHSAFFGPVKYSILPRVLGEHELVGGNGLLEGATFLAILAGTICAGLIVAGAPSAGTISIFLFTVAAVGLAASMAIPKTGVSDPSLRISLNLPRQTWEILKMAKKDRVVWLSLLGISWFWFFGALFLSELPYLGKETLHGSETVVTALLAVFSVGVALGALLCEKMSKGRVELGLVPFGSIGLSVFALELYFAANAFMAGGTIPAEPLSVLKFFMATGSFRVMADIALLGLFGGFFIVPLYALMQSRSAKAEQSRIVAANNVMNALFMVCAAGLGAGLSAAGASVPLIIAVAGILNALVALYIYSLLPEFLWRFVAWFTINTVYRVKLVHDERIPVTGAALLCPNHVSYLDALVVSAASPRPIRFVMDHAIFSIPVLGWLFKAAGAIPVASGLDEPEVLKAAYVAIDKALAEGELVCIFPEGRLTSTGQLGDFKYGALKIALSNNVPIYPMGLKGLRGSWFARCKDSRGRKSWNQLFLRRITARTGEALIVTETMKPSDLREAVKALLYPPGMGIPPDSVGP